MNENAVSRCPVLPPFAPAPISITKTHSTTSTTQQPAGIETVFLLQRQHFPNADI
jgi:hypothetical protein